MSLPSAKEILRYTEPILPARAGKNKASLPVALVSGPAGARSPCPRGGEMARLGWSPIRWHKDVPMNHPPVVARWLVVIVLLAAAGVGRAAPPAPVGGDEPDLARITAELESADGKVRARAVTALAEDGLRVGRARSLLRRAPHAGVVPPRVSERVWDLADTLVREVVARLIERAGDADTTVRQAALHALPDFGPAARPAVPALIAALGDSDFSLRVEAIAALAALDAD